jgi:hypothetical protein
MQIHSSSLSSASIGYSFKLLGPQDEAKLEDFFLSLNFDQRRRYFAGSLSNSAIAGFCKTIDWTHTKIIASCMRDRMNGMAALFYTPPNFETAELSIACSGGRDHPIIVSDLFDLATAIAPLGCEVSILRDFAMPELIQLIRERGIGTFMADEIRIPVHLMQESSVFIRNDETFKQAWKVRNGGFICR